jgi:hypothetical protein
MKYKVTIQLTQYVIVEAENEEQAANITDLESCDDDWSDPIVESLLNVEPYHGNQEPFNLTEIEAAIYHGYNPMNRSGDL